MSTTSILASDLVSNSRAVINSNFSSLTKSIAAIGLTNVYEYGAVGDGIADDTTAIQAAIDACNTAGGGTVFFPAGTYKITSALNIYTNQAFIGDGAQVSIIHQTTTNQHGFRGQGAIRWITFQDLQILGSGQNDGTGEGIYIGNGAGTATSQPHLTFRNVYIKQFGSHGFHLSFTFITLLENCRAESNGGYGFNLGKDGSLLSDAITVTNCFATGNTQIGFYFRCGYGAMVGSIAEYSGIGFFINSFAASLVGCGVENINAVDATYDGTGFKIDSANVISLSGCTVYDNDAVAFWVSTGSKDIGFYNCVEQGVDTTQTASFKTDASTTAIFIGCRYITNPSLTANTFIWQGGTPGVALGVNALPTVKGEFVGSGSGNISVAAFRSDPGGSGSANVNKILIDNTHGASSFKSEISFQASGTSQISTGVDLLGAGNRTYHIFDNIASVTRFYIDTAGQVGINTSTPNANAILDLTSTSKAFMPPRMTTTQRDAISSPTAGMVIYNTSTNKLNLYTTGWEAVTSA